jgi:hypothetical protein
VSTRVEGRKKDAILRIGTGRSRGESNSPTLVAFNEADPFKKPSAEYTEYAERHGFKLNHPGRTRLRRWELGPMSAA